MGIGQLHEGRLKVRLSRRISEMRERGTRDDRGWTVGVDGKAAHFLQQLKTVHAGHRQVRDDYIGANDM